MLNERLTRLLALEGVAVTREDIEMKATSVLQTLLPEIWRNHKCRYTHTHTPSLFLILVHTHTNKQTHTPQEEGS